MGLLDRLRTACIGTCVVSVALVACGSDPAAHGTAPVAAPPAALALRGRAADLDGRVLAGAVIHATPVAPFEGCPDARRAAETVVAADGTYGFANLDAGDWAISCSIDGAVRAPAGIVESPAVAVFDVLLPTGPQVEGTLVDDATGAPVAGATVLVHDLSYEGFVAAPTTGVDGRFSALLHRDSVWLMKFLLRAPGYADAPIGVAPDMKDSTGESERVAFSLRALRGVTLRGVVTGPAGPVAGATVTVWQQGAHTDTIERRLTTDAAGRYEVPHLLDGEAAVFARAPGLVQAETHTLEYVDADLPGSVFFWGCPDACRASIGREGEVRHDVTLVRDEAWPTCTVAGRVLTKEGEPVAGATVESTYARPPVTTTTSADGSFRLGGAWTDGETVQLSVQRDGFWRYGAAFDGPPNGTTAGVEVRLPRLPRVRGRVTLGDGTPAADARVVVVASNAPGVCEFSAGGPSGPRFTAYETRTAPDGTWSVAYRARGVLRVRAESPGLPPADFVHEGGTSDADVVADLTLAARPALTGRVVLRGTSEGAGGVPVAIVPERWDEGRWLTNDAIRSAVVRAVSEPDGTFRVADFPSGRWMLLVGGGTWTAATAAADTSSAAPLVVEVEPALSLGGTIAFADGTPASRVEVTLWPKPPDDCVGTDAVAPDRFTGDDGCFVVRGLGAARYWLTARRGAPEIERLTAGPFDAGDRAILLQVERRSASESR